MKTVFLTIAATFFMLTASFADGTKEAEVAEKARVNNYIKSEVSYPAFASETGLEGVVYVHYKLSKDGKVEVVRSAGSDDRLTAFVVNEMNELNVGKTILNTEEVRTIKFTFCLQK